tara:strand:+ start:268 stop:555 length:288 start_codon:yes stop_codon:yes gene_type:complete
LQGFLEKIGDLSWAGPSYADQGWVELTDAEQTVLRVTEIMARVEAEKTVANTALSDTFITVADKIAWSEYLLSLDAVCLCPDFDYDPKFPIRPNA